MIDRLNRYAPWLAIGAVLCALALAWNHQSENAERHAKARFQDDVSRVETAIQARLQTYVDILTGANEFIAAQRLDAALWRRYVNSLHLEQKYPTLFGLGYADYIPSERGDRFIVQLIEPRDRNARLLKYDLGSELSSRTAAERARDNQGAALTGKLILPDDADHHEFLLFFPVFRQDALQGWVFGRFRADDLLKGLAVETVTPVRLQAYDGPAMTREGIFLDTGGSLNEWRRPDEGPMTVVKGFQAAGRTWTLNVTPHPRPAIAPLKNATDGVPLFMLIGLLALGGAFAWIWSRRRAEVLARRLLGGMRLRETALTLGPQGIIIADATQPDLPVVYVNRAFEKITGYSAQDVLGKNCRFLEGTDRDQKGLVELRRALKDQRDCRVLLRNYRKDGAPFWNDLFVSPVRNDMGRVVQYVAIQQDVTDREQTLRRLATEAAIIRALAESPSLYEAVPRILQAICEAQEWDLGTFWRLDPRTQVLQCVDQWHPVDLELQDFENFIRETTVTRDMGVPGYVWAKGEQVWLPDLTKDNQFPEASLAAQAGLVSACGFPIANRRGLQGVLVFYSRRIWPLSKNLLLLMVGTGAQISQYMEREQGQIEQKELTILERGLAEFMGEGLIAMDREGFCIYVNMTAGRMLGYHPRTLLGQNAHEFLHPAASPAACEPAECPIRLSLQSTRALYVDDPVAVFSRKDRDPMPVAYTTSPIVHQDLIQGVVITFVDASARRVREQELRRALAEKEEEIKRIQQMLSQTREVKSEPNPSDLLIDKIRKLLG